MRATILVVDDDPDALLLVQHVLETAGYNVVACSDSSKLPSETIDAAIDAVVLDVVMPGLSGHDVLRSLRENPRTSGLPVLLLSARAESADRIDGLRQGADDFLSKPFEPEELVLRVQRLVGRPAPTSEAASEPRLSPELERAIERGHVEGQLYLGRYQAFDVLGEGGSGAVLRGYDPKLKRPVALKTLRLRDPKANRTEISRLLHEAVTIARFSHPNIVAVYDVGDAPDIAFIAMELVDGMSLARFLKGRRRLSAPRAVALGMNIAQGLGAAHDRKVVHRDVKPGNVLLGRDGTIKVSDFGFARVATSIAHGKREVFGTPGYLPPEMIAGEAYGPPGDCYGLGVILYRALSGRLPISAQNLHHLIQATLRQEPPPLSDLVPGAPQELTELVHRLLAKKPADRPQSGHEVADALRRIPILHEPWTLGPDELESLTHLQATPLRTHPLEGGPNEPAPLEPNLSTSPTREL